MVSWREREAHNGARFREQNEWIDAANTSFASGAPRETFVCECGDGNCAETIELTKAEYDTVRACPTRFVVVLNHENPESEVVRSETSEFAVIEKIEGWGLRVARDTDPRSQDGTDRAH